MSDEQHCKVNSVFEGLCRTLSMNDEVAVISQKFSALNTNAQRVYFVGDLLEKYSLYPEVVRVEKNDELSAKYRQEGNEAFKKKNDFLAWSLYTKSISYAKGNSECLALAYANRSAVLFGKCLYKQCLEDITNAFKNNYPNNLHEKLIQRETKARELLLNQETVRYYEKVADLRDHNKKIDCASASVEIRTSKTLGRHVVAVKDIKLGEVIAIEKPFARDLLKKCLQDHCYSCFGLSYNLMPCDSCVYAMYCSKKCQQTAWNQFHKYECPILASLYYLNLSKLTLTALRVTLQAKKNYDEIDFYKPDNPVYKSQNYEEIHFLEANTHLRNPADLFPRATTAAIIRNLVKKETSFVHDFNDWEKAEGVFNELILRHLQTAPTNFHEISECTEDEQGFFVTREIGTGAYAFLSLLNHSCTPNVVRHCHGSEIILRAIKHISEGSEVLDNYGYHFAVMKKTDRQRELQRQYFFNCICDACENDWPLYNNLPQKGKQFKIPQLDSLRRGDRSEAFSVWRYLVDTYTDVIQNQNWPTRFIADLQETLKQCYALWGNRKARF